MENIIAFFKHTMLLITLAICQITFGQNSRDFLDQARQVDFSDLWTLDSIPVENDQLVKRGFIGEEQQRIDVHFISVIQDPENQLHYLVYGQTDVKGNICDFQGVIKVDTAQMKIDDEFALLKRGFIKGSYKFFEDKDQTHTGTFNGRFVTHFFIDEKGKLQYDALYGSSIGFRNNQFEGSWTEYRSGDVRKCSWSDRRE